MHSRGRPRMPRRRGNILVWHDRSMRFSCNFNKQPAKAQTSMRIHYATQEPSMIASALYRAILVQIISEGLDDTVRIHDVSQEPSLIASAVYRGTFMMKARMKY